MSYRPSMPDSLPVIGRSTRYPSALYAFGHGHSGLGLGAITGCLVADLYAGRQPEFDVRPLSPARFALHRSAVGFRSSKIHAPASVPEFTSAAPLPA
jgi:glycine/D-amino acid oxidase-like deaminating enzyme